MCRFLCDIPSAPLKTHCRVELLYRNRSVKRLLYTFVHAYLEFFDCTVPPLACRMSAHPKYGFLFDMRCEK